MSRSGLSIGAGLAPARPARRIEPAERIHVVGAAGAGASAAALLAAAAGASVSGCDAGGPSPYTPALEAAGIPLAWAHDPVHVRRPDPPTRLAVTKALTAIQPDHPELRAARDAGIAVEPWQQTVADCAADRILVAVAGTHGKSTTAGWLVHLLVDAGGDPSAFVGALLPAALTGGTPATARVGAGPWFVVEADEYAGNFDPYGPDVAIITSIDWDHPDVFPDLGAVVDAFADWLRRAAEETRPTVIVNIADPGVSALVTRLRDWPGRLVATALVDASGPGELVDRRRQILQRSGPGGSLAGAVIARQTSAGPDGTGVEILGLGHDDQVAPVRLATAGGHNAANALGVAGAALTLGIGPAAIIQGLSSFRGVGRRLERVGEVHGVVVYDDYGHHPTAIRATLEAVRQREPGRRVWAVYEPLTYHRTAAMLDGFAAVLAEADGVAVADIWAGRDADTTVASAAGLAAAVRLRAPAHPVAAPGSVEATADWLAQSVRPGDVVLVMGGGHSYRIGPRLLELLAKG